MICLPKIAGNNSAAVCPQSVFVTFALSELGTGFGVLRALLDKITCYLSLHVLGHSKGAGIFPCKNPAKVFSARPSKRKKEESFCGDMCEFTWGFVVPGVCLNSIGSVKFVWSP